MAASSVGAAAGISSPELAAWWENFGLMVSSIKDPDALAEEMCKLELVSREAKDIIISGCYGTVENKCRSLLQIIEGKVKGQPIYFHKFLAALRRLPDLSQLATDLQTSHDRKLAGEHHLDGEHHTYTGISTENGVDAKSDVCNNDETSQPFAADKQDYDEEIESVVVSCTPSVSNDNTLQCVHSVPAKEIKLTYEDVFKLLELIHTNSSKWCLIGLCLGFLQPELETIQSMPLLLASAPTSFLRELVSQWIQWPTQDHPTEPTLGALCTALRSSLVGLGSLADEVEMEMSKSVHGNRKRGPEEGNVACAPKVLRLTDTPLLKFRQKLADFYCKQPEVPEGTWPPVKTPHYINLALIKSKAIDFAKDYVRQTIHGSIDDVIKDKDEIAYEDAFNDLDDGALVLLEGRPGCGKTTLMHKLSQDWERERFFASHLLILVHFRIFSNRSDVGLRDILRVANRDFTDEEIDEMHSLIEKDSGRGVVFALDGLDEYSPESKDNFLYHLIKRNCLVDAVVVVASRPAASQKFRKYATKHIEVLGFLRPQIREYIQSYYSEIQDKAECLWKYLENHLNVMHMCYLPLHTAMVTYLYDVEGADLPQTETEIYRHFTVWTLIRSFQKRNGDIDLDTPLIIENFDDLSGVDKKVFNLILKLAYEATVKSKQVFTHREVREHISEQLSNSSAGNEETSLGLIVIDRYFVKYGLSETYAFIHLTLQEYLAACHISYQSEEEQTEILKKHGSAENFAQVWKYLCGIGKCSLQNFKILLDETKDESGVSQRRGQKKKVVSNMSLHLHCAFESQKESMCTEVVDTYDSNISLCNQTLNPSDMTALGYVIINSKTPLKELGIVSCRLGQEGLSALMMEIKDGSSLGVETLSFWGTEIKQDMSEGFSSLLNVCPSVGTLNMSKCGLQVNTLKGISDGLSNPMSRLTALNIASNPLGTTGSAVKAFVEKLPALETVIVSVKDFQWLPQVYKLFQSKNVALRYMKEPRLTELNLYRKNIGDIGAQLLCDAMKENTGLTKIILTSNNIGDAGAQAIGEGCKSLPNLQHIDLQFNSITDASVPHLVGLMETARKLKNLFLGGNKFTDVGESQLREAAEKRNSDTTNYVRLTFYV